MDTETDLNNKGTQNRWGGKVPLFIKIQTGIRLLSALVLCWTQPVSHSGSIYFGVHPRGATTHWLTSASLPTVLHKRQNAACLYRRARYTHDNHVWFTSHEWEDLPGSQRARYKLNQTWDGKWIEKGKQNVIQIKYTGWKNISNVKLNLYSYCIYTQDTRVHWWHAAFLFYSVFSIVSLLAEHN